METPLSEVHAPGDPGPDLSGPVDAQRLRKNDVGKDEGSLGVPTPVKNPPPFHGEDFQEAAPQRSGGHSVPDFLLRSKSASTTLPYSVVHDSPVQVRPFIVMWEVSIDSLQQQVRTF